MKKRAFIILFILILSFQLISAVDFDMKESYPQGETLIAKISGNFLTSLTKENILFYEGHVRIPMDYDVAKIEDDYYVYALLSGKSAGDYSISIENIKYMKGIEITDEEIVKNFSITNETADFSIKPGFIITSGDFDIYTQNVQDSKITVTVNTETETSEIREIFLSDDSQETEFSLKSGETKKITFKLGEGELGLQEIEIKTENLIYKIPIYVLSSSKKEDFKFEPSNLIYSVPIDSLTKKTVYLYNSGNKNITNITLSLSSSLLSFMNLSVSEIENLNTKSNIVIELTFFSTEETEVEGYLNAETENLTTSSSISLKFLSDYVPSNETETTSTVKTCAELNGSICDSEKEECDGETVYAKDNVCCIGSCEQIKESYAGRIIAFIIIIAIIIGLVLFYKLKYKKVKKPINLLKIAKGKNPSFSKAPIDYNKFITSKEHKKPTEIRRPLTRPNKPIIKIVEKPVIKQVEKKVFIEKPKKPEPKYIGSSNTKTYHKSSCKFAKLIDDKYKVTSDDITYFQRLGYKPGKKCLK